MEEKKSWAHRISKFLSDSKRILRLARKPTKKEYLMIAKITGLGMIIIGLIGMTIKLIAMYIGLE